MTRRAQRPTRRWKTRELLEIVRFNDQGLVPAVIQDAQSGGVLTLCYLNQEALERSLATGLVHVFRRSQGRLMLKGETSGHLQRIQQVLVDCEGKSLVLRVRQHVAACHAGYRSCYYRILRPTGELKVVGRKVFDPSRAYASAAGDAERRPLRPPAAPPAAGRGRTWSRDAAGPAA